MQERRTGANSRPTSTTPQSSTTTNGRDGSATFEVAEPVVPVPAAQDARTRPRTAAPVPAGPRPLNIQTVTHNGITWVNIMHPGEAETEWLRKTYGFHPLHLDDILSKIQRPKIDDEDDYTFIVMHFPVYSKLVRITTPSEVDIFVGASFLITMHAGNLKPLTRLFKQCAEEPQVREQVMGRSTGYLLYSIVDRLVDYCFPILNKIDLNIEQVEDDIFGERVRKTVQEISIIRRDIIAFRRIAKPLIPVIGSLERKNRPFLNEDTEDYFGDIADHLSKMWDTLEDYKEVIEGLSDTITSLTNIRSNEIIRVLTIISVILLPLTLISGLFGMNFLLPFESNPEAFWVVIGLMVSVAIAMLAFFRVRKWI
ncbi:MAG: magnesium/cobalt transporter CorA [Chloroflexia bacterium]